MTLSLEQRRVRKARWALETASEFLADAAREAAELNEEDPKGAKKTRDRIENNLRLADAWTKEAKKRLTGER